VNERYLHLRGGIDGRRAQDCAVLHRTTTCGREPCRRTAVARGEAAHADSDVGCGRPQFRRETSKPGFAVLFAVVGIDERRLLLSQPLGHIDCKLWPLKPLTMKWAFHCRGDFLFVQLNMYALVASAAGGECWPWGSHPRRRSFTPFTPRQVQRLRRTRYSILILTATRKMIFSSPT
jgi:hypothetical protein